jgi:hypothetical protein
VTPVDRADSISRLIDGNVGPHPDT